MLAGDLGDVYRNILKTSCAPLYWYRRDRKDLAILHNGKVTFVKTPQRLLGITAAHVLNAYLADACNGDVQLQIMSGAVDDLPGRIISVSDRLDIATFAVDEGLLHRLGTEIVPLASWPPCPPQEGRGIMLSGFPAIERVAESNKVEFGLFTAIGIARTVTDLQITWLIEPEAQFADAKIAPPPSLYGLGGISGGPLIGWFESDSHLATYTLSGIVIEHPDYDGNEFNVERVVAVRADHIHESGRISS
ncbi:MAG: hypothetical protein KIT17_00930 [Rubrivivax sp.]|nr:hypothetical protein [Rubrivivax sp.]